MNIIQRVRRYWAINFSSNKNPAKRIISFWEKGGADFEYFKMAIAHSEIKSGYFLKFVYMFDDSQLNEIKKILEKSPS